MKFVIRALHILGYNVSRSYKIANPTSVGGLDKVKFIWNAFSDQGFVTAYGEDTTPVGTFNYHKKGFKIPPTDYYFRPYLMAAERSLKHTNVDSMSYCIGPESEGERILNVATSFAETLRGYPYWGLFWMNSFSHNQLNSVSRMDDRVQRFLYNLEDRGLLNDTVVVFLSDHGIRFGEFRYTKMGWLEERLPFIYMRLPNWFIDVYPGKYYRIVMSRSQTADAARQSQNGCNIGT